MGYIWITCQAWSHGHPGSLPAPPSSLWSGSEKEPQLAIQEEEKDSEQAKPVSIYHRLREA